MGVPFKLNSKLSAYTTKILSMYLKFPDNEPITAIDFRADDGSFLKKLTDKHNGDTYLFAVTEDKYDAQNARELGYYKVFQSGYKAEGRMSKNAFSLAIVDPYINSDLADEMLSVIDAFVEPDFEAREREKLKLQQEMQDEFDFAELELTEEEKKKRQEKMEEQLQQAVKQARLAYRRALREQERRFSLMRDDKFLLARVSERLMPGGILVMITPKELIDQYVTIKLCNTYEDIRIFRLDDDEYEEYRKCIILARKRKKAISDRNPGILLAETKLKPIKEIPVLEPVAEPLYEVPPQNIDAITEFRIGPLTAQEVLTIRQRSNLIENYRKIYEQSFINNDQVTPTPLHKGHIMLLLTSGNLKGYIGTGPDQHLVKGTAIKLSRVVRETDDDGNETIKEREYFHLTVKYLDRNGEFHRLM